MTTFFSSSSSNNAIDANIDSIISRAPVHLIEVGGDHALKGNRFFE